jgi:hypothetical protein
MPIVDLGFDLGEEHRAFEPVPAGTYEARCIKSSVSPGKSDPTRMVAVLQLQVTLESGNPANVWARLAFPKPEEFQADPQSGYNKGAGMAERIQKMLKSFGVPLQGTAYDPDSLVGLVCNVKVEDPGDSGLQEVTFV